MNLKVRLAAMMILLLIAVMAVQYLLAEREHRALVSRLADLTSGVDRSTREFSERAHAVFQTGEGLDSLLVIVQDAETPDGRTLLEFLGNPHFGSVRDTVVIEAEFHATGSDTVIERVHGSGHAGLRRGIFRDMVRRREGADSTGTINRTLEIRHMQGDSGLYEMRSVWMESAGEDVEDLAITLPVPLGDEGFLLRMSYPLDAITGELEAARNRSFVWLSLLLGVGVLGATLVAFQFTRPITTLQQSFHRVEEGDLNFRLAPSRRDEIGKLTESFNEMVERLDKTRLIESRLAEAERMATVGSLAAGVAHEVRNPLNAILLTLEQMRDKVAPEPDSPRRREFDRYVTNVSGEVTRLEQLVSSFLDLSNTRDLVWEPVDLGRSLQGSVQLFAPQAEASGVALTVEDADDAPTITGDPSRLTTVWNNLLSNALTATPRGGTVSVSFSRSEEELGVHVGDTGGGVAHGDLEKIWEPFYTGHASGTGLGLSIVRTVVEAHGGRVEAASTPGSGTTVSLWFPKGGKA